MAFSNRKHLAVSRDVHAAARSRLRYKPPMACVHEDTCAHPLADQQRVMVGVAESAIADCAAVIAA